MGLGLLLEIWRRRHEGSRHCSKYLVVAYKELGPQDGFVVTAYFARRLATWRERLWKR